MGQIAILGFVVIAIYKRYTRLLDPRYMVRTDHGGHFKNVFGLFKNKYYPKVHKRSFTRIIKSH